jgi:tetratricopeptide (TPR) repeat protein
LFNRGRAYRESGRPFLSKQCLEKLLEIHPTFPSAKEELAQTKVQIENMEAQIAGAERALAERPTDLRIYRDLSEFYRKSGRLEEAVKLMEKACELSQDAPPVIASLAWLLATNPDDSIRDGKRAVELAEKAVRMTNGKELEALYILIAAYAEAGDFEKAKATAQKAIGMAKESAPDRVPLLERRLARVTAKQPIRMARDR